MNSLLTIAALSLLSLGQDVPTDIAKKDLPAKAECVVCNAAGNNHGAEKPAAGVMYKGKAYYFCNAKEAPEFKKSPDNYLPPVFPRPMPAFSIADTTGKMWDADAMKGKVVMIDFWATWCGPCKQMMPTLDKVHEKYGKRGFELLSVSVDAKKADLDKFLGDHKFPNPVLHDTTKTFAGWGVKFIPATFLIVDGKIVAQWSGVVKEKALTDEIDKHLKPAN